VSSRSVVVVVAVVVVVDDGVAVVEDGSPAVPSPHAPSAATRAAAVTSVRLRRITVGAA
jgi:hypothetical protein